VYSTRVRPCTQGPCAAGCTKSLDRTVAVADGQFMSNWPRCSAVCTAESFRCASIWLWVAQPDTTIATPSTACLVQRFVLILRLQFIIFFILLVLRCPARSRT